VSEFRTFADGHRSGFASFVGRPNAGKSTLTNALVGQKIVITSDKPQTTRTVVRGIVHRDDAQLILVDTPGLHRPRTLLGQRLNDVVRATLAEVDVVGFCVPADERIGPGDRFIAGELAAQRAPVVAVVTKTDAVPKARVAEQLMALSKIGDFADIVPVSAVAGEQVGLLADLLVGYLPEGPQLYPDDVTTDNDAETRFAELVREAALDGVRDELPHSIAVTIDEIRRRESGLQEIFATIHLERGHHRRDAPPGFRSAGDLRDRPSRTRQPEGHRHRSAGRPARAHRDDGPGRDRSAAGRADPSRPARRRRARLAA
jgi:GTP-binding protein Era